MVQGAWASITTTYVHSRAFDFSTVSWLYLLFLCFVFWYMFFRFPAASFTITLPLLITLPLSYLTFYYLHNIICFLHK